MVIVSVADIRSITADFIFHHENTTFSLLFFKHCVTAWGQTNCKKSYLILRNNFHVYLPVFGLALCSQFDIATRKAPILVERCVRALEERAYINASLDLYKVYHNSPPNEQIIELRKELNHGEYPNPPDKLEDSQGFWHNVRPRMLTMLYSFFFFTDVCNADLSSYSPQCIASVLKKFLRELPDPVIPVQWYDRFLEASSTHIYFDTNTIK